MTSSRAVIGAAIEVHRHLGPGYQEKVYEDALCVELGLRGMAFELQKPVSVVYKNRKVGSGVIDLVVGERLVVEMKTVDTLLPVHSAQVISYLRALGTQLGLLLNFRVAVMKDGTKRVVLT